MEALQFEVPILTLNESLQKLGQTRKINFRQCTRTRYDGLAGEGLRMQTITIYTVEKACIALQHL